MWRRNQKTDGRNHWNNVAATNLFLISQSLAWGPSGPLQSLQHVVCPGNAVQPQPFWHGTNSCDPAGLGFAAVAGDGVAYTGVPLTTGTAGEGAT
eukprot:CAMPEP_0172894312 /NCGR_PEP_ID=MMETSP1075-20121228/150635_1 /TAXON_ID=2916 /ORGANISM="Ceratium fusus, Strain PA161109" /LENGTH=94 /DNA_ID=CAMNT_0013749317 /DNA_START=1338 /DNA_END=1618 /DNA_ORIENTATION=+